MSWAQKLSLSMVLFAICTKQLHGQFDPVEVKSGVPVRLKPGESYRVMVPPSITQMSVSVCCSKDNVFVTMKRGRDGRDVNFLNQIDYKEPAAGEWFISATHGNRELSIEQKAAELSKWVLRVTLYTADGEVKPDGPNVDALDLISEPQVVGRFQSVTDLEIPASGERILRLSIPRFTAGVRINAASAKEKIEVVGYRNTIDRDLGPIRCGKPAKTVVCEYNTNPGTHYITVTGKPATSARLTVDMYPGTPLVTPIQLKSGVPLKQQSSAAGESKVYEIRVRPNARSITFKTSGGGADVGLYVKMASHPITNDVVCRSQEPRTTEQACVIEKPASYGHATFEESWYATLYSPRAFSGVAITATIDGIAGTSVTAKNSPKTNSQDDAIEAALAKKNDKQIDDALNKRKGTGATAGDVESQITKKLNKGKGSCERTLSAYRTYSSTERESFCTTLAVPGHPEITLAGNYPNEYAGEGSLVLNADGSCNIEGLRGRSISGPCKWGVALEPDGSIANYDEGENGLRLTVVLDIPEKSANHAWSTTILLQRVEVEGRSRRYMSIGGTWVKEY
jgi:hypothetical protein